jgi:hypothetical protein
MVEGSYADFPLMMSEYPDDVVVNAPLNAEAHWKAYCYFYCRVYQHVMD